MKERDKSSVFGWHRGRHRGKEATKSGIVPRQMGEFEHGDRKMIVERNRQIRFAFAKEICEGTTRVEMPDDKGPRYLCAKIVTVDCAFPQRQQ
jgi:hypothetical protein